MAILIWALVGLACEVVFKGVSLLVAAPLKELSIDVRLEGLFK